MAEGDSKAYPGLAYHNDSLEAYSNGLDGLLGRLMRKAIDAYMCGECDGYSQHWTRESSIGHYSLADNRYKIRIANWDGTEIRPRAGGRSQRPDDPVGPNVYVTAPDPVTGEGGGQVEADNGDWNDFGAEFDAVRRRIGKRIGRWTTLPDPDIVADVVNAFTDIAAQLAPDSGTMRPSVETIRSLTDYDSMQGRTITAFKTAFSEPLIDVLKIRSGIAAAVAAYMKAQVGLWGAARMNLVDIVKAYTAAFDAVAKNGKGDVEVLIRVLQYAASAVGVNGLSGWLGLAEDTLDIASWASQGSTGHRSGPGSYEAGVKDFTRALDELQENVRFTEEEIYRKIGEDIQTLGSTGAQGRRPQPQGGTPNSGVNHRALADLSAYTASRDSPDGGRTMDDFYIADESKIAWCGDTVSQIVDVQMVALVESLSGLAAMAVTWDDDISLVVQRDSRIGLGTYGPSWMVRELNELLCDLIGDLCEDIADKGDQLEAAYAYHLSRDEAVRARLAAANAAYLADSGAYDPWDYEVPTRRGRNGLDVVVVPDQHDDQFDKPREPLEF